MNKRGFTLIEIVMVLVLLGILAAVAVPKYFDLKSKAEQQTAKAVAAEYQARINASFAEEILQDKSCSDARKAAITEANLMKDETEHGFTITELDNTDTTAKTLELKLNKDTVDFGPYTIAIPVCKETYTAAP